MEHKKYVCLLCGFVYDEKSGLPENGIPPGTKWNSLETTWTCLGCDAEKEDFMLVEQ